MNLEDRLNVVADRYRRLGFRVVLHPKAEDLPSFAKDFKVQILATKEVPGEAAQRLAGARWVR